MTSVARHRSAGTRHSSGGRHGGKACLAEIRARLAQQCGGDDSGDGTVRDAVDAAVGPLAGAIPLVDTAAVRSVDDGDLVWCAQAVQRAINVLEGARSALAAEAVRRRLPARRGEASGAETLVNATAIGGALARRIEREAQALGAQPLVADALGRGDINSDQAAMVAAAEVPDEVRRELCIQAKNQTADQTRQTVRAAEAAWRCESDAQRRARQRAARSASMWVDSHDGMWHLRAKLDALTGDAVNRLLVAAIERNWRSDKDLPKSQRRSVPQRAADALVWLLTAANTQDANAAPGDAASPGFAQGVDSAGVDASSPDSVRHAGSAAQDAVSAAGGTEAASAAPEGAAVAGAPPARPAFRDTGAVTGVGPGDGCWVVPSPTQMIVLTTLDNLRGNPPCGRPDGGCTCAASRPANDLLAVPGATAITETGTVLGAADLRRIACDTGVIPVVMGGPGEVLDVGRAKRTIPPAIRRALIARDQGCVWPGCDRAPIHCEGHHIEHWFDDGPTSLNNLALLCHTHHQRLHEYNLMLHPPTAPAPPGEGWTVTPAPPRTPRTPSGDHVRQNC